jgi:hypothetical protein
MQLEDKTGRKRESTARSWEEDQAKFKEVSMIFGFQQQKKKRKLIAQLLHEKRKIMY